MVDALVEIKPGITLFDYRRPSDWLKAAANLGLFRGLIPKDFLIVSAEQAIAKGRELVINYLRHRPSAKSAEDALTLPQTFNAQSLDLDTIVVFSKQTQILTQLEPPVNWEILKHLNQSLNDEESTQEEGIGAIVELPKTPFKILVAFLRPPTDADDQDLKVWEQLMRAKELNPEVIYQVPIGVRRNKVIRAPGFSLTQVDIFDYFKVIK